MSIKINDVIFNNNKLSIEKFNNKLIFYKNIEKNLIKIDDEFKLFNWYIDINTELLICKTRSISNNKINYFHFNIYHYILCIEENIEKYKNILKFIDDFKLGKYEILKNFTELYQKNYDNTLSFDELLDEKKIQQLINFKFKEHNVYLIKTIFKIENVDDETINIQKMYYKNWFFILNNIKPAGIYKVDLEVEKLDLENHYFVIDSKIKYFFSNEIIKNFNFYNIISLDIECQNNGSFPNPLYNPISHIGIDYYNDNNVKYNRCFTLIAIDLITDIDKLNTNNTLNKLYNYTINKDNIYKILLDNEPFKFMSERNILLFIKYLLELQHIDYILTYNGNMFDYNYIFERCKIYNIENIENLTIYKIETKLKYKTETYANVKNNNSIIFYDIFNYVKRNYNNLASYTLNYFSQYLFKLKCNLKKINNLILVTPCETNNIEYVKLFYKILRTANYCFINELSYDIINKDKIISNYDKIYDINEFENSINKPFHIIEHNHEFYKKDGIYEIALSKDAIDIANIDSYNNYNIEKAIIYAKYCLHDAILCKYIFQSENIHVKIESLANIYLLSQGESFIFKSNSNSMGPFLSELMLNKRILIKNNTIDFGDYEGGKVYPPIQKYIKNPVLCFDFQSLYPNIIHLHNISPENIILIFRTNNIAEHINANEIIYNKFKKPDFNIVFINKNNTYLYMVIDQRQKGIIPLMIKKGLDIRLQYKKNMKQYKEDDMLYILYDQMQYTMKIFINSIYGLLASKFFIFSCKFSAQACTYFSKEKLIFTYELLNKSIIKNNKWYPNQINNIFNDNQILECYNFKKYNIDNNFKLIVVYGDTDSNMIKIESLNNIKEKINIKDATKIGFELFNILNNEIFYNKILFEFENIYFDLIMLEKKKYTVKSLDPNIVLHNDNIELYIKNYNKGISVIRRDYAQFHKNSIYKLITFIKENMDLTDNIDTFDNILLNEINKIINIILFDYNNLNINDYILTMIYNKNTKTSTHYIKNKVEIFNNNPRHKEKISPGDRFKYIYITSSILSDKKILDNIFFDFESLKKVTDKLWILDPNDIYIPENYRLAIEIYINRLFNDIKKYLINENNILKIINRYFTKNKINNIIIDEDIIVEENLDIEEIIN